MNSDYIKIWEIILNFELTLRNGGDSGIEN